MKFGGGFTPRSLRPIQVRKLKLFKVSIQGKLTLMSIKGIKNKKIQITFQNEVPGKMHLTICLSKVIDCWSQLPMSINFQDEVIEVRESRTGYFIPVHYGLGVWPDGKIAAAVVGVIWNSGWYSGQETILGGFPMDWGGGDSSLRRETRVLHRISIQILWA